MVRSAPFAAVFVGWSAPKARIVEPTVNWSSVSFANPKTSISTSDPTEAELPETTVADGRMLSVTFFV